MVARRQSWLLPRAEDGQPAYQPFQDDVPGLVPVDVKYRPQLPDADLCRYRFAAIDRATRWVAVEILPERSAAGAQGFLTHLLQAAPFRITNLLTDNGQELTDRFGATGEREPTGQPGCDRIGAAQDLEHRLIPPRHPQTNGMIARCNGRLSAVLATRRCRSGEHLAATLRRYVHVYHHLPQRALGHGCPVAALEQWRLKQPELFVSEVSNLPGLDR